MNVLYLLNYAGKAGIEKYVENLCRLLPAAGFHCYFAYNLAGPLSEKLAAVGVECLQLSLEWKDALSAARRLADFCRERDIQVIHTQCPRENVIALLARRRQRRLRVVYTSHFTTPCGPAWRLLNRHFTAQNHRVIAVCRETRDVLIANGCRPEKITVIYNGVEPAPAAPASDKLRRELELGEDAFLMCSLARLAPEKGLDFLIRVMGRLRELTDAPFCCAVAGDGELRPELEAQIWAAGLERQVRLLGFRSDTQELLAGAQLYLCTSACNEALSFAVLEAMNAGLPQLLTDVGGNRDLAETGIRCGQVLPYGDTEGFARAILDLMEDPARRAALSAAAREKIRASFDLNQLALDVAETYRP